jgi:hypothetical protein
MLSKSDRVHAHETVQVYCLTHSLHLVALISLPFRFSYVDPSGPRSANVDNTSKVTKFLPLIFAKEEVWREAVGREAIELVMLTRDYVKMLRGSSGRVIVVSGCIDSCFTCTLKISFLAQASQKAC